MADKNSVMIIDDEKANLFYLNHLLGVEYTIYLIRDAGEAVERAKEYRPDLILLDVVMPEMSGYDLITALKRTDETRAIPVIFITGLSDSSDEIKGLDLGADDYIAKPFHDAIVKLRVRNQIKIVNQMRLIERLSMIDQLTEIANRRSFDSQIYTDWRMAIRSKTEISLLMIDVDGFKAYNDTYGHQQGDAVLQTVAAVLKRTLFRATDFAARWGGEEFAVLLPMTDVQGAMAVAEAIRENVENTTITCADGTVTNVTVSIGVNTQVPSRDVSVTGFLSDADKALYTAKKTGKNRVCIA